MVLRTVSITLALLVGAACNGGPAQTDCEKLCRELYQSCGFAAYPDFNSCMDGCSYNEEQGADIAGELTCVQEAQCDEFAIMECEHAYGPQ